MTHICIGKLTIIGSDNGLLPGWRSGHYLNQCWNIVNWTLGNKLQWDLYQNLNIFIQENAFENVVWKMAAILSRPQCDNHHTDLCPSIQSGAYHVSTIVYMSGIVCNPLTLCVHNSLLSQEKQEALGDSIREHYRCAGSGPKHWNLCSKHDWLPSEGGTHQWPLTVNKCMFPELCHGCR